MKKIITVLLTGLLIINSISFSFASSAIEDLMKSGAEDAKNSLISVGSSVNASVEAYLSDLRDVEGHWAESNIQDLIDKGVFKGYPDGTFRPDNEISVIEFIKSLVASSYTDREYIQGSPWYQVYVDEAVKRNIMSVNEFDSLTRPITRYEMALLIARAGEDKGNIETLTIDKTDFSDDSLFTSNERDIINAVSTAGIITGYPDGNFGSDKKATREEASVMLNRFLDLHTIEEAIEEKTEVEKMFANVLASKMVSLTSLLDIQKLVDQEETIYCKPGCYMEDGVLKVGDSSNMEQGLKDIIDFGRVLQPHAETNDHKVSFVGGRGAAIGVEYGENEQQLQENLEMFYMGYYRDVDWANEEEIDGKTYEFEKTVTIGAGLFANKRLERKFPKTSEYMEYRESHIDMDEDVLNAFYDGLRVLDDDRAEELFEKMTSDYIYAKRNQYGDPNNPKTEFFKIDGQLIYREDIRSSDGRYRYITYRFVK